MLIRYSRGNLKVRRYSLANMMFVQGFQRLFYIFPHFLLSRRKSSLSKGRTCMKDRSSVNDTRDKCRRHNLMSGLPCLTEPPLCHSLILRKLYDANEVADVLGVNRNIEIIVFCVIGLRSGFN